MIEIKNLHKSYGSNEVLNGQGSISKTQINGGDSFTIQGVINDANWDWNPLQEPVLYVIMPEGLAFKAVSCIIALKNEFPA